MALQNLISTQFARDSLYIIGFSAYARELKADQLPYVRWDESVLGTNMHHALMMAQNLLAKHKTGTRQIIMISDGEPTAHLERGRMLLRLPAEPDHDSRDAERGQALHAEEDHDQHLHAGPQLLPERVRQPDGQDEQGPRLLHDARTTSASTSWSTTSATSARASTASGSCHDCPTSTASRYTCIPGTIRRRIFHAKYGEYEAQVRLDTLAISEGSLPARARRLVLEWAELHLDELLQNWRIAESRSSDFIPVEPLA